MPRKYLKRINLVTWVVFILVTYFVLLLVLVSLERQSTDSSIHNFFDAFWYSVVTLTTVGYGDVYPVSPSGKIIGLTFVLGSLAILGMLVGNITEKLNEKREVKKMGLKGTKFKNHIVILGWDSFAKSITEQLLNAEREIAIITDKRDDIDLIPQEFPYKSIFVLYSELDNYNCIRKANLDRAYMVLVNLQSDAEKLIAILNLKKHFTDLNFTVILDNVDLKDTFQSAGVTYVLSKNEIASKLVASYIFEPAVAEFTTDLMSSNKSSDQYDLQQYLVLEKNPYVNQKYGEVFFNFKNRFNCFLLGISKFQDNKRTLLKLPPNDTLIETGDYLIVILNKIQTIKVEKFFGVKEGLAI